MAAVLPFIGPILGVIGTIQSASAHRDAANYNATVNQQRADAATAQGEADAAAQRRVNAARMGDMRAGYGASGVTLEGSPLDVLGSSAAQMEMDTQNIRYNATVKAIGYSNTATLDTARGEAAWRAGMFSAAGKSLLIADEAVNGKGSGSQFPAYPQGNNPDEWN